MMLSGWNIWLYLKQNWSLAASRPELHAVALETQGETFITADEIYYRKAQSLGRILLLQDYRE